MANEQNKTTLMTTTAVLETVWSKLRNGFYLFSTQLAFKWIAAFQQSVNPHVAKVTRTADRWCAVEGESRAGRCCRCLLTTNKNRSCHGNRLLSTVLRSKQNDTTILAAKSPHLHWFTMLKHQSAVAVAMDVNERERR